MSSKRKFYYERQKETKRLMNSIVTTHRPEMLSDAMNIDISETEVNVQPQNLLYADPLIPILEENTHMIDEPFLFDDPTITDFPENNDWSQHDDFLFETSSNSDINIENESNNIQNDSCNDLSFLLFFWCMQFSISNNALSALLVILQKFHPDLPKDSRTFKKTPRNTKVETMNEGSYYHFGLKDTLTQFLKHHASTFIGNILNIDIGIDGLPIFKSSKSQFWPILGNVFGYPDVFVIGNFHGHSKPVNSDIFLHKFIVDAKKFLEEGIFFNSKKYFIKFRAFVCDAPARSFVLQIKGHTGYSGCTKCTDHGKHLVHRMTFPNLSAPLRTDESFTERQDRNHHHFYEPMALEKINIGCVSQFPLDYMHCVLLGVMKQLLTLWIKVRSRPFSLHNDQIEMISKYMLMLAPQIPSEFQRKPRGLSDFERFKATELRLFLLYIGPVVLKENLPNIYYKHFLKLHTAIRILSDVEDCISNNELAKNMLVDFVQEFKPLYGDHTINFNVHNLIHLANDVLSFGNLDNYSAFKFENYMQILKKKIRKGSQALTQLVNRITEEKGVIEKYGDTNSKKYPILGRKLRMNCYESVEMKEFKLSIKPPNNFCILNGKVIKIEAIKYENELSFIGKVVKHLRAFFVYPINSTDLNIFSSINDLDFHDEIQFLNRNIQKVVCLKLGDSTVFLPNIHTA